MLKLFYGGKGHQKHHRISRRDASNSRGLEKLGEKGENCNFDRLDVRSLNRSWSFDICRGGGLIRKHIPNALSKFATSKHKLKLSWTLNGLEIGRKFGISSWFYRAQAGRPGALKTNRPGRFGKPARLVFVGWAQKLFFFRPPSFICNDPNIFLKIVSTLGTSFF